MVLCILSHHVFHDPAQFDFLDIGIRHIFTVPQDRHVITDLHDLLKPVRNIYDGDALLQKLSHDLEKHLYLSGRKGRSRLIHDQNAKIILYQVSGDLHHLLLSDTQVSDQGIRRYLVLQPFQDHVCAFAVLCVIQKQTVLLFMSDKDILKHRHVREQAQLLVNDPDSSFPCGVGILKVDLLSVHIHFSGRGLFDPCDHLSFDLVYVDNNSTPELLVRSEEYGNQVDIVSYYNGKLLDLQDLGFDGAVYVKAHSGLIYEECGRQGIYHKYITKLNNGKKKVIASGTQEAQDAAMTTYTYTWNGKEVTKAEYESLPSKIYQVQKGEDVEFFTYYSYNELYMLLDSFK